MRRSWAPSQVEKQINEDVNSKSVFGPPKSKKRTRDTTITQDNLSKYRKPLLVLNQSNGILNVIVDHEEIIKKLSRPFKCPVPNYLGSNSTKNLGIKRSQVRRALYDPNTPNALILYKPPEVSEHDRLKNDS